MKKLCSVFLTLALLTACASADDFLFKPSDWGKKPPEGEMPPLSDGEMPPAPDGGARPAPAVRPDAYAAANEVTDNRTLSGEFNSIAADESAILVSSGHAVIRDASVTRESSDSVGGDTASFYGVGAAVLITGGSAEIADSVIDSDAPGGAGVFAFENGSAVVNNCAITTRGDCSGGIHVAGGGAVTANDCAVTTFGNSSAAIRSDRGGGNILVNGGSYTSNGSGSPAVYVTADITVNAATLSANASEALCLEGFNTVRLNDCVLSGNMSDLDQNDNTWTVILYQSMSGDAEEGLGVFEMNGGTLNSENGGLFYTTNTQSVFTLKNVTVCQSADCEYFLRCTGNTNARGWGAPNANGADCVFTAIEQRVDGNIIVDSISNLTVYLTDNSGFTGAVIADDSAVTNPGAGVCDLYIDDSSAWIVTESCAVNTLACAGIITDINGLSVTIRNADGTTYLEGSGPCVITVNHYTTICDPVDANPIDRY